MNLESIVSQIAQTIQKEANVDAIFGEPRKLDEHVIIPVARMEIKVNGGGAGLGAGSNGAGSNGGDQSRMGMGGHGEMGGQSGMRGQYEASGQVGGGEHESERGQSQKVGQSQSEKPEKTQAGKTASGKADAGGKAEMSGKGEAGGKAEKGEKSEKGEKAEMSGEMSGAMEMGKSKGLLGHLGSSLSQMAGKGSGVGGEFEIQVVPLGFIRDGKNGAEFVSIEQTPEGLLGRFEHLIKNLRSGGNGRQQIEKQS